MSARTALVERLGASVSGRAGKSTETATMSGEATAEASALVERLGTGIGSAAGQATRCITHDTDRGNGQIRIIQQDHCNESDITIRTHTRGTKLAGYLRWYGAAETVAKMTAANTTNDCILLSSEQTSHTNKSSRQLGTACDCAMMLQ